jgi:hypothetical protein
MTTTSLLPDVGIELREEYTPEEIERYVESWSQLRRCDRHPACVIEPTASEASPAPRRR